jgi:aryl-alcohol dehydrogenase-like predicted oxidoreductase
MLIGGAMEYRYLGHSGLRISELALGTATFGGGTAFFKAWGSADVEEARRMVDLALEHGINLLDTADVYSDGLSEQIVGEVLKGRRHRLLISTKSTFRLGSGPNDVGFSRHHLLSSVDASLRRLQTDYIDLYHLHGFDARTPLEELLSTLDQLVRSGRIRYVAASNFSGWHLMKALAIADRYGWPRFVAHQVYYSLLGREYEWELMPLARDQDVGAIVWSPLGWGRLTGRIGRNKPVPTQSRLHETADAGPPVDEASLFRVTDALEAVAEETGKSVPQIAINWLLNRPTVASVLIGARNEAQLEQNIRAAGWRLAAGQIARLDAASRKSPVSPYWHQARFSERNPFPTDIGGSAVPL